MLVMDYTVQAYVSGNDVTTEKAEGKSVQIRFTLGWMSAFRKVDAYRLLAYSACGCQCGIVDGLEMLAQRPSTSALNHFNVLALAGVSSHKEI